MYLLIKKSFRSDKKNLLSFKVNKFIGSLSALVILGNLFVVFSYFTQTIHLKLEMGILSTIIGITISFYFLISELHFIKSGKNNVIFSILSTLVFQFILILIYMAEYFSDVLDS